MIRHIYRFTDREFHPIFMLLWYLDDNVRSHFINSDQYLAHVNLLVRSVLSPTPVLNQMSASPPIDPKNQFRCRIFYPYLELRLWQLAQNMHSDMVKILGAKKCDGGVKLLYNDIL